MDPHVRPTSLIINRTPRVAKVTSLHPLIIEHKKQPHLQLEKAFILALERLPVLWDKTHPKYTNKFKRNEALLQLLIHLRRINPLATVEHVRMKINSLRSNYRRELRRVLASQRFESTTADEVYTPKAWSYELLGFLYNTEKPKNQVSDSSDTGGVKTEFEVAPEAIYIYNAATQSQENSCKPEPHLPDEESPSCSKKVKIKDEFIENEAVDHEITCSSEPNTNENNIQLQETNTNQYIAMEWAQTLNRLDPVQRIYAKKAINDILFEAELGNLRRVENNSNDIARPSSDIQILDRIV